MSRPATIPSLQRLHRTLLAGVLLPSLVLLAAPAIAQVARAGAANDAAMQDAIAAAKAGRLAPSQADALRLFGQMDGA